MLPTHRPTQVPTGKTLFKFTFFFVMIQINKSFDEIFGLACTSECRVGSVLENIEGCTMGSNVFSVADFCEEICSNGLVLGEEITKGACPINFEYGTYFYHTEIIF